MVAAGGRAATWGLSNLVSAEAVDVFGEIFKIEVGLSGALLG